MNGPEANSRIPWLSRRRLLGGLAGLTAAELLASQVAGQNSAPAATPDATPVYSTTGSSDSPYQMVLFSQLDISLEVLNGIAAAVNSQIWNDFGPIWGIWGTITLLPTVTPTGQNVWPIEIISSNAGNCFIADSGHFAMHPCDCTPGPQAYVQYDENHPRLLAHAVSHEALEMLANPLLNNFYELPSLLPAQGDVQYIREVCDPCWEIDYGYPSGEQTGNLIVSDFVTPDYFAADRTPVAGVPYSFKGSVTSPLGIALGCNQQWAELDMKQWWQGVRSLNGFTVSTIDVGTANCSP